MFDHISKSDLATGTYGRSLPLEECPPSFTRFAVVVDTSARESAAQRKGSKSLAKMCGIMRRPCPPRGAERASRGGRGHGAGHLRDPLLDLLDQLELDLDAFTRVRSWRDRLRERPLVQERVAVRRRERARVAR